MSSSIFRGRRIICQVSGRDEVHIVDEGGVLVRDGRIVEIGDYQSLRRRLPDLPVHGSADTVISPGFVNSHHHVGLTPFQLGSPDLPLELWFASRIGTRPVDPYLDTLYSGFEMIASGVTTVQHLHVARVGPSAVVQDLSAGVLRAYQELGMRVSYTFGYRDQNRLVYGDDEEFLKTLPTELVEPLRAWFDRQYMPMREQLALFESLRAQYHGADDGRVAIQLSPTNLHWCSDEALQAIGEISAQHDVPIHLHLLETPYQKEYARRRTGGSAVEHVHRLGIMSPRLTLGHATWVTERDLDIISDTGTCICHNPSSNLRLRSGIAPCNHFFRRGITVGLGMDEASLNDDRDMLQEMRLALRLHRTPGLDEHEVPNAAEIFRMATEGGAHTTGFADQIGILAPGRAADLVLFDGTALEGPYMDPDMPLLEVLLRRARPEYVRAVAVAGRVIYEDGVFAGVDRDDALAALKDSLSSPPDAAQCRMQDLAKAVMPHVRGFYDDYAPLTDAQVFSDYRYNSMR
jgi:cytosine/adenosine deaminase-related metal-dependent hydrolase